MKFYLSYCIVGCVLLFVFDAPKQVFAAVNTAAEKYQEGEEVKILIVPGHDGQYSGAVYQGVREAAMNVALAQKLKEVLSADPQLTVVVARDGDSYIRSLNRYFETKEKVVERFLKQNKRETRRMIENGRIVITEQVKHNDAPELAAYRLYAINKWSQEMHFDMVIHIHFNDDGLRKGSKAGQFSGYTVYVPETGLLNAREGKNLGDAIGAQLQRVIYPSNLPEENAKANRNGVVEDFQLIALGANRTQRIPSVLIEYSYIYEPAVLSQFFSETAKIMASATASGILNYIREVDQDSLLINYIWNKNLLPNKKKDVDVLMMQYALKEQKLIPPEGFDRSQCVVDGVYGKCTQAALKEFQQKNNLGVDGVFGEKTRALLNSLSQAPQVE